MNFCMRDKQAKTHYFSQSWCRKNKKLKPKEKQKQRKEKENAIFCEQFGC